MATDRPRGRAIVVGASMAGLLAARVLAEQYAEVLVVERDRLPSRPGPRRGLPQAAHVHVLVERGLRLLEELFPGITRQLGDAGAVRIETGREALWLTPRGWQAPHERGAMLMSCSRELLDVCVRRRVQELPGFSFLDETAVAGLLGDGEAVRGAVLRPARGGGEEKALPAELVVDASGRGSRAPVWLAALGLAPPEESVVDAGVAYATRIYARQASDLRPWKAVYQQLGAPTRLRGGLLAPIEGDRWLLTLTGAGGDHPPADEGGFDAFLASLQDPLPAVARRLEPLTPISVYKATRNRLRHYEGRPPPEGLVVLGDAVAAFNPIYGQGLTTAGRAAVTLRRCLERGGDLTRRFQRQLAAVNRAPWLLATAEDYRVPTVRGEPPPPGTALAHAYVGRVFTASTHSPFVARRLQAVMHMLDGPAALLRPEVLVPSLLPARALRAVSATRARQSPSVRHASGRAG